MNPGEFDFIADVLKKRSGLSLSKDKTYLLESRLNPIARDNGYDDLSGLITALRTRPTDKLLSEVTDAMTTNESFFFRDKTPFDLFENIMLPALQKSRGSRRKVRIWCAAASTGQEPYSLAIVIKEMAAKLQGWNFEIVGTDICEAVLDKARKGTYSQFEVQRGLPIKLLVKYFDKAGEGWQVKPEIRNMVKYKTFNLLEPFSGLGQFDIIFCRNVLIYFDQPTKKGILERLNERVPTDGFLVLGAAESVFGVTESFSPSRGNRGLYLPKGAVEPEKIAS